MYMKQLLVGSSHRENMMTTALPAQPTPIAQLSLKKENLIQITQSCVHARGYNIKKGM